MSDQNKLTARPQFEYIIPRLESSVQHQKELYRKKPTTYRLKQINRVVGLYNYWMLEKQKYDGQ